MLHYLAAAVDLPAEVNRTFDVGGPDVLTYREMIQRFARDRRPAPAADRHRAGAHAAAGEPVGRLRDAGAERHRPPAGRQPGPRGGLRASTTSTRWSGRRPAGRSGYDAAVEAAIAGDDTDPRPEPGTVDPARITAADPSWAG